MRENSNGRWLPTIIVSDVDKGRLTGLATAALGNASKIAEELLSEMERASVVSAGAVPPSVVQMGSTIEFGYTDGRRKRVTLVFPGQADISEGKISVLTPVGAALIGLSEGQTITSMRPDGLEQELTVFSVEPSPTAS
jgi:regulator of nucleoside diphosphate kinase